MDKTELKYMRKELPDDFGFLKLQDKILEIMVYIDEVCREHNINYCLLGGSALGAVRHGGFIPWDDDLDIFMSLDDYEKFRDVFQKQGDKERFYLQERAETDGMIHMAKLRANNTAYIENNIKDLDMHHGIFVDIFINHKSPTDEKKQKKQRFWARYVAAKGLVGRDFKKRTGIEAVLFGLLGMTPRRMLVKHALKEVYRYRDLTNDFVYSHFFWNVSHKKSIYKREWLENCQYMDFETVKLRVPNSVHDYLTQYFGDYMKIPSPEAIKAMQHAEAWDTEKSFEVLLERKCTFNDEKMWI